MHVACSCVPCCPSLSPPASLLLHSSTTPTQQLPWSQAPHVHSWLSVREATSGSGVRGLGVMSGATKTLAMGGHGDTLLSGKCILNMTPGSGVRD